MSYMQHIQHLIEMLKSDNQNERLVACKELMDARHPLPKEAIDALNSVTNDSNSEVAGAAQQALAFHAQVEKEKNATNEGEKLAVANTVKYWPLIGIIVGLIPSLLFSSGSGIVFGLYFGFGGIPGGILGAYIGKRDTGPAVIGAVLGALLGSLLWIFLFTGGGIY